MRAGKSPIASTSRLNPVISNLNPSPIMIPPSITPRTAFAAIAGLALAAESTFATSVPAPANGDIFLAFRASGGDGAAESYIVKLGPSTSFLTAPSGSSFTVSGLGDISSDLTAKYGPTWNTRGDLFWGIFGLSSGVSPQIYGSRQRNPPITVATAWPALDTISLNTTASQINSVLNGNYGYRVLDATANSAVAAFQSNAANTSSYNYQVASAGTTDFGSTSAWASIEGNFASGTSATVLDLFRIASAGVTRVGNFTISNAGAVQFTALPSSVPVDSDGDGVSDADEALAGTNPNDPNDLFRVQALSRSAAGTGVSFKTIPARTYLIYYSPDLAASAWQLIATIAGGASPATIEYVDSDPVRVARPTGFYKVAVTQ